MSSQVKIVSTTMVGNDKAVRISVSEYQSLLNYKPGTDETTIVVASESCPEEDLKAIESYCQLLDFSFEGRQKIEDVNNGESSTGAGNDGVAGSSTNEQSSTGTGNHGAAGSSTNESQK